MAANGRTVNFDRNGGKVSMEFVIGDAQWGRFRSFLWNNDGTNPKEIGHGVNTDNVPDVYTVPGRVADLEQKLVSWEVAIGPLGDAKTQLYNVSVRFSQDGKPLAGGVILDSGELGNGKFINDFITLKAQ